MRRLFNRVCVRAQRNRERRTLVVGNGDATRHRRCGASGVRRHLFTSIARQPGRPMKCKSDACFRRPEAAKRRPSVRSSFVDISLARSVKCKSTHFLAEPTRQVFVGVRAQVIAVRRESDVLRAHIHTRAHTQTRTWYTSVECIPTAVMSVTVLVASSHGGD